LHPLSGSKTRANDTKKNVRSHAVRGKAERHKIQKSSLKKYDKEVKTRKTLSIPKKEKLGKF
jgi:hypothetical protein